MSGLKKRGLVWFVVPWLAGVGACAKQQVRPDALPPALQPAEQPVEQPAPEAAAVEERDWTRPVFFSPSKGIAQEVRHLLFARYGERLVLSTGWWLSVYEFPSGQHIAGVNHKGDVGFIAPDRQGDFLASTSFGYPEDRNARIVNLNTGTLVTNLEHPDAVDHIAFHPDGKHVVTAYDDKVRLWDRFDGGTVVAEHTLPEIVGSMALSPDGELLAVSNDVFASAPRVRLLEARSGQERGSVEPEGRVARVYFSPDGQWLATKGGARVQLWDVASGRQRYAFDHPDSVSHFSFSPDGNYLVTSAEASFRECQSPECAVAVVRVARTGEVVSRLRHEGGVVQQLVFSPDGRYLASSNGISAAHIWEVATGKEVARLEQATTALAFSQDGKHFAMGTHGIAFAVWSMEPVLSPSAPKPWRFQLPKPTESTSAR